MTILLNIPDGYYRVPSWEKPKIGDLYLDETMYNHRIDWVEIKEGDEELHYNVSDFVVLIRKDEEA